MIQKRHLLYLGLVILVVVGILTVYGLGVYPNPQPVSPNQISCNTATVTFAATTQIACITYATSSLQTSQTLGGVTYGASGVLNQSCGPNCSVQIFPLNGPIVSDQQYCQYFKAYYGVSYCPIPSGGGDASALQGSGISPQSLVRLSIIGDSQDQTKRLVNLAWLLGNVTAPLPFVDMNILILLVIGLILIYTQRKELKPLTNKLQ